MGGQNNKPIAVSNAFGALLDDDKKKKKKKKEEEKEAPLKSLSPMVNSSMNWADCADSDEDEFGGTPKWGDTMEPMAADTPPEAAEQEEEPALEELGMQEQPAAEPASADPEPAPSTEAQAPQGEGGKRRKRGGKKNNNAAGEGAPAADPSDPHPTLDPDLKGAVQDNGALDKDSVAKLLAAKHGAKKKASGSAAASVAAKEAAARNKNKKNKSKDKKNYNQQPTR